MARPTLSSHPKFAKLSARLKSRALARGVLELIWETCYASGEPVVGDAEALEAIADWRGEPGELASHLSWAGFVEADQQGLYRVVDFEWMWARPTRTEYGSDWRAVRDGIVARDGGVCASCGSDRRLEVHHRRPIVLFEGDLEAANHPANLITLCRPCHRTEDNRLRKLRRTS